MNKPKPPAERLLDTVVLTPVELPADFDPQGMPYATHTGVLAIGDLKIDVVVLNTGQRLLSGKVMDDLVNGFLKL